MQIVDTPASHRAATLTVGQMLHKAARVQRDVIAVQDGRVSWTYSQLEERVNRLANSLLAAGARPGDRVAVLAENCHQYLELELAAAKAGFAVACINWRLADDELAYCVRLTDPAAILVSDRYRAVLERIDHRVGRVIHLGDDYEAFLAASSAEEPDVEVDPETGLLILYTSGTTGLPKGAVISHRAMVARAMVSTVELGLDRHDAFLAWPPLFHMAGSDFSLATLMMGGKVVVSDGLDFDVLVDTLGSERLGWLVAMPGMVDRFIEVLIERKPAIRGVKVVGAMADLVPLHEIAELTRLLGAPYLNSFGSTEAGLAPASGGLLPPGELPATLSKRETTFCDIRLVAPDGRDVPDGEPGEVIVRGPTLFSGYWDAPDVNARDFRDGWFHTGDMLVRAPDGRLDFVDRVKYLIKTGGENVYPAEIERVLLADPRVRDAVVVRKADSRWGEVPVAFVARNDESLTEEDLRAGFDGRLARYKIPKEIHFVSFDDLPRSTTGKIQRHQVEKWLVGPSSVAADQP